MGSKPWLQPAPTYHPLESLWDTEDDAPGPRCGHTLTAVAQTKTQGPRLILFGGATSIGGGPSSVVPGIRLDGFTNSVHVFHVLTRKWTRIWPAGEPPSPRAAHAAAAVGAMVVFQGGIGPTGHSTDDLYVLDLTNDKYKWHRVVVRGEGPGPRYGHVMDLVAQRYLVCVSGNDGKKVLSDAWALDTAQKPYVWQKLNPEGDKPSARMYATASARSDGMFLLCGGRDISGTPLADAYGLIMHTNGQWEWTLAPGVSPSPRYQHAAVFAGARLHVTGGVLWGGRAVDGEAVVAEFGKTEPLSDEFFPAEPNGASKKLTGLSVTPVKVLSDSDLKKSPTASSMMTSATLAMVPSEALLQISDAIENEKVVNKTFKIYNVDPSVCGRVARAVAKKYGDTGFTGQLNIT